MKKGEWASAEERKTEREGPTGRPARERRLRDERREGLELVLLEHAMP